MIAHDAQGSLFAPAPAAMRVAVDRAAGPSRGAVAMFHDGKFEQLIAAPDKVTFIERATDQLVAAVSSERSCRCRGNDAIKKAHGIRDGSIVPCENDPDPDQLEAEGVLLLARARHHDGRVKAIQAVLAQYLTYPTRA